jgi:two-component system, sensor histidine kinase PdtaS
LAEFLFPRSNAASVPGAGTVPNCSQMVFQLPWGSAVGRATRKQNQRDALTSELQAARARETAWLREKSDLLQRQDMLTQEFEHRLVNGLQIIVSLLSLQSRRVSPEAAD